MWLYLTIPYLLGPTLIGYAVSAPFWLADTEVGIWARCADYESSSVRATCCAVSMTACPNTGHLLLPSVADAGKWHCFQVHWLRVILDEGHLLGNSLTMTNKLHMACALISERRWVMTGAADSPLPVMTHRTFLLPDPGFSCNHCRMPCAHYSLCTCMPQSKICPALFSASSASTSVHALQVPSRWHGTEQDMQGRNFHYLGFRSVHRNNDAFACWAMPLLLVLSISQVPGCA
jgi:hypothetical protein